MKKGNLGRDKPQSGVSRGQIRTIEGWAIDEAAEVVAAGQDGFGRIATALKIIAMDPGLGFRDGR
jgi:hypothetical protein